MRVRPLRWRKRSRLIGSFWIDEQARNTARAEGLKVVGLLAFLILAKEPGIISHVKPLLDALRRQGFFIGDELYHHILRQADEL